MARESVRARRARAEEFCRRMEARYPHVESALVYETPFELLVSVMLSAQTTDAAVNRVTPALFARWGTPEAMAQASVAEVGETIRSIGFWRTKAAHVVEASRMIVADWGGEVPRTMEGLTSLPGVGRKTANIVLNKAFGQVEGIAVDTHVFRIARRLHFSDAPTPLACEQDLLRLLPHDLWKDVNEQWIHFGREVCSAHAPRCGECPVADLCPSAGTAEGNPKAPARRRGARAGKGARGASEGDAKGAAGGRRGRATASGPAAKPGTDAGARPATDGGARADTEADA